MIKRKLLPEITSHSFQGDVIIIVGPRQVGKTTLIDTLLTDIDRQRITRYNGDYLRDRSTLGFSSEREMRALFESYDYIVIDEAQKVPDIGNILKSLIDTYGSTKQIFVTGSSTLGILDQTTEPLTGRKRVYHLYPIAFSEMVDTSGLRDARDRLEEYMLYGMYPQILGYTDAKSKREKLEDIVSGQLYRDILEFQEVKNPLILTKLLELLALQVGSEVSYHALGQSLGVSQATVERYVDLLEKSFVIFRLRPYATNKIKEVTKMKKIYFTDLGVRNALLGSFQPLSLRTDLGALWENFFILERRKYLEYERTFSKTYFWRTKLQEEIDYIEEGDGMLSVYECKWKEQRYTLPGAFRSLYGDIPPLLIHEKNYWEYV